MDHTRGLIEHSPATLSPTMLTAPAPPSESARKDGPASQMLEPPRPSTRARSFKGSLRSAKNEPAQTELRKVKTLAELWEDAVVDYLNTTKKSITELVKAKDIKQAFNAQAAASKRYSAERHPAGKSDKVIQVSEACSDWISAGADFIASNISGSFGAPAQILAGAIGLVVAAAHGVTESLNLIDDIFTEINRVMRDIKVLEDRIPDHGDFDERLVAVFTSILDFCGFATTVFEGRGRLRLFFSAFSSRTEEVVAKSEKVKVALLEFRNALVVHTTAMTSDIDRKTNVIDRTVTKTDQTVTKTDQKVTLIDETVTKTDQAVTGIDLKTSNIDQQTRDIQRQMREWPDNLIALIKERKIDPNALQLLSSQSDSLKKIKKAWEKILLETTQNETSISSIKSRLVEGTFDWVEHEDRFLTWQNGQHEPFLYIDGEAGTGKTYFTYSIQQRLHRATKPRAKSTVVLLLLSQAWTFNKLIFEIIYQVAKQDQKVAQIVADRLTPEQVQKGEDFNPRPYWQDVIQRTYSKDSTQGKSLYILLDGIGQAKDSVDHESMIELFKRLDCSRHSIQIMFTGTGSEFQTLKALNPRRLALSEYIGKDMVKFIDYRIKNSTDLKNFTPEFRNEISKEIVTRAKGDFSYVDICMSIIEPIGAEYTGREAKARDAIDQLQTGEEGVHAAMATIVLKGRSRLHEEILQFLFSWMAFAKEALTVHQIKHLLALDNKLEDFDFEGEIQDKLRIMLYIEQRSPAEQDAPTAETEDSTEQQPSNTSSKEPSKASETAYVRFRKENLRDYLRSKDNVLIKDIRGMQIHIFHRLVNIICHGSLDGATPRQAVQEYAVNYILDHFMDIPMVDGHDEHIVKIVTALAMLFLNTNDAHLVIEDVLKSMTYEWYPLWLYDSFTTLLGVPAMLPQNKIMKCVRKAGFQDSEELDSTTRAWMMDLERHPNRLFEPLAKGHIKSWVSKVTREDAYLPFSLAYRALNRASYIGSGHYSAYEFPNKQTIQEVRKAVRKIEKKMKNGQGRSQERKLQTSEASSNIAAALLLVKQDMTYSAIVDRQYARDLYEDNIKTCKGAELFYSQLGLAEFYAHETLSTAESLGGVTDYTNAGVCADLALKERNTDHGGLGADLNPDRVIQAYSLRAYALAKAGKISDAEDVYRKGLDDFKERSYPRLSELIDGYLRSLYLQGKYLDIMLALKNLSAATRAEYLHWRALIWGGASFSYDVWEGQTFEETQTLPCVRRAAVETRRSDQLIRYYEEAIDYWTSRSTSSAMILTYTAARIYRTDMRATAMAKLEMSKIMTANVDSPGSEMLLRYVLESLFDIIHEEFTLTKSIHVRRGCLVQLTKLMKQLADSTILVNMELAWSYLVLAKLNRGLNNIEKAREHAQEAFRLCLSDLEDNTGDNDQYALSVLAVVLEFVGLDTDASIALSLQFSRVDTSYVDSDFEDDGGRSIADYSDDISDPGSPARFPSVPVNADSPIARIRSAPATPSTRSRASSIKSLTSPKLISDAGTKSPNTNGLHMAARIDETKLVNEKSQNGGVLAGEYNKAPEQLENRNHSVDVVSSNDSQQIVQITNARGTPQQQTPGDEQQLKQLPASSTKGEEPESAREDAFPHETKIGSTEVRTDDEKPVAAVQTPVTTATNALPTPPEDVQPKLTLKTHFENRPEEQNPDVKNQSNAHTATAKPNSAINKLPNGTSPTTALPVTAISGLSHLSTPIGSPLLEDVHGDLNDQGTQSITCSGICQYATYKKWEGNHPKWRCVDCPNIVLCEACYEVQLAYNEDRGNGTWRRTCWGKHKFLPQPIAGWKGVREGVIRIGGTEREFREWVRVVKARWIVALAKLHPTDQQESMVR